MTPNMTKEEFTAYTRQRIGMREQVLKGYNNVVSAAIKKFDGKVLNKRFWDYLNAELAKVSRCYQVFTGTHVQHAYELRYKVQEFDYNDYEDLRFIVFTDDNKRIDATKSAEMTARWLEGFNDATTARQESVDNYDEYMQVATALDNAVKAYNALPFPFRRNLNNNYNFNVY